MDRDGSQCKIATRTEKNDKFLISSYKKFELLINPSKF
jgi:hypothetical protein